MIGDFLKRTIAKVAKPACPQCGESIAPEDLDLRGGTMRCRACGHVSAIKVDGEEITRAERMNASVGDWTPEGDPVPQPEKSKVRSESTARHLRLHRSRRHLGVAFFLLFWLTGWTVGCVLLVLQVVEEPSVENLLFAMIFGAPWLLVTGIFLYMLTGYETLTLTSSRITRRAGMVFGGRERSVPIDHVRDIRCFDYVLNSKTKTRGIGLEILTTGPTIRFGKGLSEDEIRWLDDTIRRYLYRHDVHLAGEREEVLSAEADSEAVASPGGQAEVLRDDEPTLRPPMDASFRYRRGFSEIVLQRRGSWKGNFGGFVVMTFLVLFWNGILSLFVWELFNNFDWFSFLFLIPFELIGLAMILGWFALLTAPLCTRRFTFERGMVTRRLAWAFLGYKTRYVLGDLDRIELRSAPPSGAVGAPSDRHGGRYSLVFVDTGGGEALEIKPLTEAEGRWMGDQLVRDLPGVGVSIRT